MIAKFLIAWFLLAGLALHAADTWRSAYYPENWTSEFRTADGKFLHDFSYAGYHRGEKEIPDVKGAPIDVTQAPYNADASGVKDSTAAIQGALDAAAKAGGGVVFLPAGTYRVAPPTPESLVVLQVPGNNIVLRGAGVGKTFIFNDSTAMRGKHVIQMMNGEISGYTVVGNFWHKDNPKATALLTADVLFPTTRLSVQDTAAFAVGDLVAVRADVTPRFIEQLGMTGKWLAPDDPKSSKSAKYLLVGSIYCRRIVSIDAAAKKIVIDVPTRFELHTADNARVVKLTDPMITECGLEDFSIGMKQHPAQGWEFYIPRLNPPLAKGETRSPGDPTWGEGAFDTAGTAAYDVHGSYAIAFKRAENCWVRRVNTYQPPGNTGVHLISNGFLLEQSRFVTVEDCDLKDAQYQGGGGNGYLYVMHGEECLLRNCTGDGGRHNYDFGAMHTSGNVILRCTVKNGKLPSDFHMYFSVANLFDNTTCDGDSLEANYRPYGGPVPHGVTTTQSVFWNTQGLRYPIARSWFDGHPAGRKQVVVDSHQWGDGYVIGTRGPAAAVESDNHVEGVDKGDTLQPPSLYEDQLARRLKK